MKRFLIRKGNSCHTKDSGKFCSGGFSLSSKKGRGKNSSKISFGSGKNKQYLSGKVTGNDVKNFFRKEKTVSIDGRSSVQMKTLSDGNIQVKTGVLGRGGDIKTPEQVATVLNNV